MKKILIFHILLLFNFAVSSQKKGQLDSLLRELPNIKNDTLKARTYLKIAEKYFFIDVEKALSYNRLGLEQAKKMNWEKGIGVFNSGIGRAYSDKANYDSCLFYYNRAFAIHKKMSDYFNMASVLNNKGAAEQNLKSNYPKATKLYFEALKVAENLPDKYVTAICLDNISSIYLFQKNYTKALEYGFKGLNLREKLTKVEKTNITNGIEIGNSLTSIGNIYVEMKDFIRAKPFFEKAIREHQKAENKEGLAKAYSNLALTFVNDFQKKIEFGLKSKKLWDEVNPNNLEAINNIANIGIMYLDLVKNDTLNKLKSQRKQFLNLSKLYLQNAINLSEKNGEIAYKAHSLGNLAELQALKGDYKNAYNNFRAYQNAQDSLYSQENKNKIAGLESEREIAIRDKEILINKLTIDSQKQVKKELIWGLGLLSIIGGLLFWQNQTRKKTNTTLLHLNSELDEANKIKAKFFAILSHDLRSPVANLISFLQLQKNAPDLLTEEIKNRNQQEIAESAEILLENMESMLLWSKGQMENFKPQVKQIAINDFFEYLQKFFANTAHVKISFENKDNLTVSTDEDYLKTIMQNLTNNAIKALKSSPNGIIHWKAEQQNDQIILSITDNGSGISEQQIASLYDENALFGSKSGLGLYLIRDLAKAIACKISVKSSLGLGSEFQLAFVQT
jgi:signal transduction histidine kinase